VTRAFSTGFDLEKTSTRTADCWAFAMALNASRRIAMEEMRRVFFRRESVFQGIEFAEGLAAPGA